MKIFWISITASFWHCVVTLLNYNKVSWKRRHGLFRRYTIWWCEHQSNPNESSKASRPAELQPEEDDSDGVEGNAGVTCGRQCFESWAGGMTSASSASAFDVGDFSSSSSLSSCEDIVTGAIAC